MGMVSGVTGSMLLSAPPIVGKGNTWIVSITFERTLKVAEREPPGSEQIQRVDVEQTWTPHVATMGANIWQWEPSGMVPSVEGSVDRGQFWIHVPLMQEPYIITSRELHPGKC